MGGGGRWRTQVLGSSGPGIFVVFCLLEKKKKSFHYLVLDPEDSFLFCALVLVFINCFWVSFGGRDSITDLPRPQPPWLPNTKPATPPPPCCPPWPPTQPLPPRPPIPGEGREGVRGAQDGLPAVFMIMFLQSLGFLILSCFFFFSDKLGGGGGDWGRGIGKGPALGVTALRPCFCTELVVDSLFSSNKQRNTVPLLLLLLALSAVCGVLLRPSPHQAHCPQVTRARPEQEDEELGCTLAPRGSAGEEVLEETWRIPLTWPWGCRGPPRTSASQAPLCFYKIMLTGREQGCRPTRPAFPLKSGFLASLGVAVPGAGFWMAAGGWD